MACDPLSLTASLIAVVQVSHSVLLFCYQIRGQIKDAHDEISRIITDVEALGAILDELEGILPFSAAPSGASASLLDDWSLDDGSSATRVSVSVACISSMKSCETVLTELREKLKPLARPGLKSKLIWPFESSNIQRKLNILVKQKGTLQLILSACNTRMLDEQSHRLDEQQRNSKRTDILTWYKTSDPEQNHRVSRSKHEPDTAKWIFDVEDFRNWKDKPGESLWIQGIPGAGKTILCSTIIDYMSQNYGGDPSNRIVYFYFDFVDSGKQTVVSLLKSIIYQLISAGTVMPDCAANLYTKCNALEQPSVDELVEVVIIEISRTSRTFLMIDALDECPTEERQLFFETFVQGSLPSNLNLLITSRKEPDIDAVLSPSFSRTICIENAVIDADVKVYVGKAIVRDAKLSRWKPAIQEEILNAVVEGSHGMFRWAVCQLDIVKTCLSPAMLRIELKRMPETIDQTYDRILQNVASRHKPFVQSALHWLAFAKRPLLLQELAEAAVLQPRSGNFDPDLFRLLDENLILELCGTLVIASTVVVYGHSSDDWLSEKLRIHGGFYSSYMNNNKFKIVSLSHYSVKEYIASQRLERGALSNFYASEKLANTYLAECCLFYLLQFNRGEIAFELDFMESPLLEYAACNWMSHWNQASTSGQSELRHLAESFFDSKSSKAYVNWLNTWSPDTNLESTSRDFQYRRDTKKSAESLPPMLYWVASLGDLALLQSLVENGAEISKRGGKFEYPLGAAVYHGHSDVVRYLLQQGADPNFLSRDFGNVLQISALGGSVDVVKQLIDAGADVNVQGGSYNTAVIAAASRDNFEVVALLLNSGADLKVGSSSHGSSLYQAAAAGNTTMVIALLAAGADLNGIGDSEGTPLYAAAESGSLSLVQLLLRRGADVNKGTSSALYGYPVMIAAKKGHSQVVRALIRGGADVNLSTGHHRRRSTLEASIEGRDMSTFLAILNAGADPNVSGNLYVNCFHAAIWTGEIEMAKILLERGAETEEEGFLEAVRRHEKHPWFLEKLLQKNPNCNVWTDNDGSALHVAIKQDDEEAAWTILNQDPFLDAVSEDGTPLGVAIKMGMIDLAKELIHRGADVNRRGKGDSPFNLAVNLACNEGKGDLTLADMLLEHGADCNLGIREWVVGICKENQEGVLRYLVRKGVDLDLVAPRVNCTPLQYAAKEGNRRTIDLLLELGADINGPKGENGSTIDYALMSGNESIVRYFLDKGAAIHDSETDCGSIRRAILYELTDLIPLLLEKGADLNPPSKRCSTAAEAFENAPKEIFKMLMDQGAVFSNDFSTLERTIKKRELNELNELLEYGLDPNVPGDWKQAVTVAADIGAKDAVDLLIEYGADLNKVPQDRNSFLTGRQGPLVAACRNGDLNMTQFLLERGADPNIDNKDYGCPLACAVDDAGNLKLVELLLHSGANIEVKLEIFSRAIFGGERVISRLLEEPMTKEDRERYLDQALQSAAYWAILEMCSWLLDEGANPNYHGGRWGSPLTAAITANHNIHQSAGINNRRLIIDLLLRHGADVNQSTVYTSPKRDPNVNGDTFTTPLLLSLENGPTSTAQKILEAGADPNIPGGEMHLPLQTAARCRWAMVEPLLAAGAEVNAVGGEYGSALHAAAYTQNIDTIKLLLAHGADVTITAGKYGSVLQAAAKSEPMSTGGIPGRDSVAAMKLLVAAGADVHTRCGKYGSLLQMAAKSGNLRGMRWLVEEMGVDVNVKGGRFGSVRAAAVMKGRWAVLSYLENKYGKFKWGGETNKDDKWIGWVTE